MKITARPLSVTRSRDKSGAIYFDDEPIESIVYGPRSAGPSNASVFVGVYPEIDAINSALDSDRVSEGLEQMGRLLSGDLLLPLRSCLGFLQLLQSLVPTCPKPILPKEAAKCGPVLHHLLAYADRFEVGALRSATQTLAYRWHEAYGGYKEARAIITSMLAVAESKISRQNRASLINNYGYEYLLEGRHAEAEPYFLEAIKRFTELGQDSEVANARANLLTCRWAGLSADERGSLVHEVCQANRVLTHCHDWRVRKTMRLLADRAVFRGNVHVAVAWARRAAHASRNIPSQHHHEDQKFLRRLERRRRSVADTKLH